MLLLLSRSVMSNSVRPHGLQPTRLLHPWDFPGKSTGVGCHCLLCCLSEVTLENPTNSLRSLALSTGNALNRFLTSLNSLANVIMDNRLALDYLQAKQSGVGAIINKIYCTYVNKAVQIEKDLKKIYE